MVPAILVADDHALFRSGLRLLLRDSFPDLEVREAADLDAALECAGTAQPLSLILIDLNMPGMDGIESLAALRCGFPEVPLAVISASESKDHILGALAAGAAGYIPKSLSPAATRDAIAALMRGDAFVPAAQLRGASRPATPSERRSDGGLTPRQRDVGRLLTDGLPTKEIARRLGLGEGTVKAHLAGLFRRVGARNRLDAALKLRALLARD